METNNRRDFLKKAALAGASALVAPSLFAADGEGRGELSPKIKAGDLESKLIVPPEHDTSIREALPRQRCRREPLSE